MPGPIPQLRDRNLQLLRRRRRVEDPSRLEVDPYAAYARFRHRVEVRRAGLVVDDGNSPRALGTKPAEAIQRGGIVGPVDARRHDHDVIHMQGVL